jgi:hypothetical protein
MGLTLAKKFDAVHNVTTTRSRQIPSVLLAVLAIPGRLALNDDSMEVPIFHQRC